MSIQNWEETEKCSHQFWKDENPPICLFCGKTKYQLLENQTRQKAIKECVDKVLDFVMYKHKDFVERLSEKGQQEYREKVKSKLTNLLK